MLSASSILLVYFFKVSFKVIVVSFFETDLLVRFILRFQYIIYHYKVPFQHNMVTFFPTGVLYSIFSISFSFLLNNKSIIDGWSIHLTLVFCLICWVNKKSCVNSSRSKFHWLSVAFTSEFIQSTRILQLKSPVSTILLDLSSISCNIDHMFITVRLL